MLGEIENDIEKFKIALNNKDKQLLNLGKFLKAGKKWISKSSKRKKQLREHIITNRKEKRI